jgi:hypothetical protein
MTLGYVVINRITYYSILSDLKWHESNVIKTDTLKPLTYNNAFKIEKRVNIPDQRYPYVFVCNSLLRCI